jgi:hypothetical protein
MIIGILKLLFILGVLPFLCGLWFVKKIEITTGKIATSFVSGYIMMFALFQVVFTVAQILTNQIQPIVVGFSITFVCISVLSLIYARKELPKMFKNIIELLKKKKTIGTYITLTICILLLVFPILMSFLYQYADGDDSYYLALATAISKSGMLNGNLPYTGGTTAIDLRHAWAGGVSFTAYLSRITGIHTAIIAHLLLPPFLFVIMYMIYWLIAKVLLKNKKSYIPLFMIIIAVMYVFGNVSIYTETTFMITRTWQGKAIFSNLIVPILILCFLKMKEKGNCPSYWIGIALVGISSVFASIMGIIFAPVFIGLATHIIAIANKKWKYLVWYMLSMIPVLCYSGLYFRG